MSDIAELKLNGQSYTLPVVEGSEKEKAIDISALRSQAGWILLMTDAATRVTRAALRSLTAKRHPALRGIPIENSPNIRRS